MPENDRSFPMQISRAAICGCLFLAGAEAAKFDTLIKKINPLEAD